MSGTLPPDVSPCQHCGACCASFRVSFYFAEAQANHLPEDYVERINERFSCMAGTNTAAPRCEALAGTIGENVACRVYAARTSPCREVQPGDAQCLKARAKHGLPPLLC
jgi:Fe-S-cluster containining protein